MRSLRSLEKALAVARRRGKTRASVPVTTLAAFLESVRPAIESQAEVERTVTRTLRQIARALTS